MCGIVGYVGARPCRELLIAGLRRLEYRGYDSAGLALLGADGVERIRAVGNLAALQATVAARTAGAVATLAPEPVTGIGHTRWATHGRVTERNAHPHADGAERIHIVLNGIVENHVELRARLEAAGVRFSSETDAEVVAHLVAAHRDGDLLAAVAAARAELVGHFAFVALSADEPGRLVATRRACPLVVGVGDGEHFVGSSAHAFAAHTRRAQPLGDDEIVVLEADAARFFGAGMAPVQRAAEELPDLDADVERGADGTFMLREIHEQPAAFARTVFGQLDARRDGRGATGALGMTDDELAGLRRLTIVGCGTSYHAGLVGRYAIEAWARLPVALEIASEYRYREPVVGPGDLVVGITQSGETADTLAAMALARRAGARVVAVTNVAASQAARDADAVLLTRAGTEIGVAATKTFTAQVAAMYLLGLELARARAALPVARLHGLEEELRRMPSALERLLAGVGAPVAALADRWHGAGFFLLIGRHVGMPVALEGALKLKEITYIPTDAYAAGEMKHGPIALLDERTPVICVATDSCVLDKTLSNVAEVRARGAHVIAIATEGSEHVAAHVDDVVWVPRTDSILQAALAVVPLQLLAYEIARRRGLDVDQPRNLAKTVTVE